jgi:hypothetical protein
MFPAHSDKKKPFVDIPIPNAGWVYDTKSYSRIAMRIKSFKMYLDKGTEVL